MQRLYDLQTRFQFYSAFPPAMRRVIFCFLKCPSRRMRLAIFAFPHTGISAIHAQVKSFKSAFARKGPDAVTVELVSVLSQKASFEFKPLFEIIHTNLHARKAAGSSEEMLRLRIYEKLQQLVAQGAVKKTIAGEVKKYRGTTSLASILPAVPVGIQ